MITVLKVILLSFIEGLTEFIPVSSTGHLILVDHFIKLSSNHQFVVAFEVIIQLGAILAVLVYFKDKIFPININLWLKIIVASIPAGILGILFDNFIEKKLFNIYVVSFTLVFYGIILILIENKKNQAIIHKLDDIDYKTAFMVGMFQCLALVPGTSRSASTIIGGLLLGLSRIVATELSFFMAIPVMTGASLLKLFKISGLSINEYLYILLGFVLSFVFAYIFIKMFMQYIKKHNFKIFGYYRIIIGLLVLIILWR